ncbi:MULTISPECIES: ABC transporter permease [Cytobacillus]|uniref:ABC transporter permease n=1 Tax=Cytobacillus stercorigallinarum TaxID=2762240 RepID=A0ABR8QQ93_9BACI|nr:ABC transporter permease [Cytobacillus stercorigallinarum]MBD7937704.1 ABC transporter permease [Cytobacillus stercorigallinarum]
MFSFIKKDLLVFWRDRKEVLISLLAPILILVVLHVAFSGISVKDAGEMDLRVGLILEDDKATGLKQFEEALLEMDLREIEIDAMMEQAETLSPIGIMVKLFEDPELSSWIHTIEMNEEEAQKQIENGELDAIIKIPEGFTYDVLGKVMLDEPVETPIRFQIEEHSLETDILAGVIDNYMEALNFQFALSAVTGGEEGSEPALPQGGREVIKENAVEIELAQYYTIGMSSLFALFIAATVAAKTVTEKRERVFNRILLTNSRPFSYLMGKVISTFCMAWIQLMLVFVVTDLMLGIFPEKSTEFWLGIIVIVTFFSLSISGLSAIFTSLTIRMHNINTANGLFTMVVMGFAALGGNFFSLEQFPEWVQALSQWTPTGVVIDLFTEFSQNGNAISFAVPLMKQFGFFIGFLVIGILLFPERGKS